MAGAETWVIVRYRGGAFRLPIDAPIAEAVRGVKDGWQLNRVHRAGADVVERQGDEGKWRTLGEGSSLRSWRERQG
jgi:hypothetical protein